MNFLESSILLSLGSIAAGLIGALSGLGGGILIVPILVIVLQVDMHYAIGASLIAVIATSSGASAAYVKEGYSNIRLGMLLETATSFGAIFGTILAGIVPLGILYLVFGLVLLYSAWGVYFPPRDQVEEEKASHLAQFFRLDSHYPYKDGFKSYHVQNVLAGYFFMLVAGMISGLLGIGSGALKVLAMDKAMNLPFKVSTTTSNFMIGVTAATSAGIYLNMGYIDPPLTMSVVIGVIIGSFLGARLLPKTHTTSLRHFFTYLVLILGMKMLYEGLVREF